MATPDNKMATSTAGNVEPKTTQVAPTPQKVAQPPLNTDGTNPLATTGQQPTPVTIVPATTTVTTPETAAPDGGDPSKFPRDGTSLEGLAGGVAGTNGPAGGTPSAAVLDGNPPAYVIGDKPEQEVKEPTAPQRFVTNMRMTDFQEGGEVFKLGVSHPPYKVETVGKGYVLLRSGTGGAVQVTNDAEASFFTNDQSRQYAVADGNPNATGDVKAP